MIPYLTYSIKVVYVITFIAFKIYVRIELYVVPMIQPDHLALEGYSEILEKLEAQPPTLPIASYSFNCIYCARCNLGFSCKSHVPPPRKPSGSQ